MDQGLITKKINLYFQDAAASQENPANTYVINPLSPDEAIVKPTTDAEKPSSLLRPLYYSNDGKPSKRYIRLSEEFLSGPSAFGMIEEMEKWPEIKLEARKDAEDLSGGMNPSPPSLKTEADKLVLSSFSRRDHLNKLHEKGIFLVKRSSSAVALPLRICQELKIPAASLQRVDWLSPELHFYSLPANLKISELSLYKAGGFLGIDAASGAAVQALRLEVEDRVLDLCCAPGAKLMLVCDILQYLRRAESARVQYEEVEMEAAEGTNKASSVKAASPMAEGVNTVPSNWMGKKENDFDFQQLLSHTQENPVIGVDISNTRLQSCSSLCRKYAIHNVQLLRADGTVFNPSARESYEYVAKARKGRKRRKKWVAKTKGNENRAMRLSNEYEKFQGNCLSIEGLKGLFSQNECKDEAEGISRGCGATWSCKESQDDNTQRREMQRGKIGIAEGGEGMGINGQDREDEAEYEKGGGLSSSPSTNPSTDLQAASLPLLFEKVLVDAECTHDGSSRHIEKFEHQWGWKKFEEKFVNSCKLANVPALQLKLIENGFKLLKKQGILVYSTCSFQEEQNEDIISELLKNHEDAVLYPLPCILPQGITSDCCCIVRQDALLSEEEKLYSSKDTVVEKRVQCRSKKRREDGENDSTHSSNIYNWEEIGGCTYASKGEEYDCLVEREEVAHSAQVEAKRLGKTAATNSAASYHSLSKPSTYTSREATSGGLTKSTIPIESTTDGNDLAISWCMYTPPSTLFLPHSKAASSSSVSALKMDKDCVCGLPVWPAKPSKLEYDVSLKRHEDASYPGAVCSAFFTPEVSNTSGLFIASLSKV